MQDGKLRKNPITGLFRFSLREFLAALILLLVSSPFLGRLEIGDLIESILLTLVLISAVLAIGHRRQALWLSVVLVIPPILGKWLHHYWPETFFPDLYLIGGLVFMVFVTQQLMRFILRAPRVNSEVLCAGIASYLLLGLLWAFAYMLVWHRFPDAFAFNVGQDAPHGMQGFTSLYFSYITLSTVGYGDITPVKDVARMLAAAESMTGTLFVAVLISRLVSLYSSDPANKKRPEGID